MADKSIIGVSAVGLVLLFIALAIMAYKLSKLKQMQQQIPTGNKTTHNTTTTEQTIGSPSTKTNDEKHATYDINHISQSNKGEFEKWIDHTSNEIMKSIKNFYNPQKEQKNKTGYIVLEYSNLFTKIDSTINDQKPEIQNPTHQKAIQFIIAGKILRSFSSYIGGLEKHNGLDNIHTRDSAYAICASEIVEQNIAPHLIFNHIQKHKILLDTCDTRTSMDEHTNNLTNIVKHYKYFLNSLDRQTPGPLDGTTIHGKGEIPVIS